MIEPPPEQVTMNQAMEWMIRALRDEDVPVLLCGRSALDYQGAEHTGSTDIDILIGADFRGANYVLGNYVSRGDLYPAGATHGSVVRYLVSGWVAVDVMDVSAGNPRLFRLLGEASVPLALGSAGPVGAVTREGYFVLAVLLGLRGFAKEKGDPMAKVRESWAMFGERTDRRKVDGLLAQLGHPGALDEALKEPSGGRGRARGRHPRPRSAPARGHGRRARQK